MKITTLFTNRITGVPIDGLIGGKITWLQIELKKPIRAGCWFLFKVMRRDASRSLTVNKRRNM